MIERYQSYDVLVFDDLDAEKLTDWVEEQFCLLVDDRSRQRLPVLASSARKEALAQRLDRRVIDRLRRRVRWSRSLGRTSRTGWSWLPTFEPIPLWPGERAQKSGRSKRYQGQGSFLPGHMKSIA